MIVEVQWTWIREVVQKEGFMFGIRYFELKTRNYIRDSEIDARIP